MPTLSNPELCRGRSALQTPVFLRMSANSSTSASSFSATVSSSASSASLSALSRAFSSSSSSVASASASSSSLSSSSISSSSSTPQCSSGSSADPNFSFRSLSISAIASMCASSSLNLLPFSSTRRNFGSPSLPARSNASTPFVVISLNCNLSNSTSLLCPLANFSKTLMAPLAPRRSSPTPSSFNFDQPPITSARAPAPLNVKVLSCISNVSKLLQ